MAVLYGSGLGDHVHNPRYSTADLLTLNGGTYMSGYNSPDYIRGMQDQQLNDSTHDLIKSFFGSEPKPERDYTHELEMQKEFTQQATKLIDALKHAQKSRDEWKTYAKRLESIVEGAWAIRDALRDEINRCPNHSAHPIGLNKDAQIKLSDAAYIKEARKNNLPESDWNENVRERNK
ncbi:hypothetical protein [Methylovulum sp.]|uniref:hypothetical protein n=1 Tax=Methylovulum sp. TaxID=1916980 RepID=UPI00262F77BD|nr:hypothetical protein [Methylovulum sp.]MDD5125269.1 hypothetical protein [Methylovulum sp.]